MQAMPIFSSSFFLRPSSKPARFLDLFLVKADLDKDDKEKGETNDATY